MYRMDVSEEGTLALTQDFYIARYPMQRDLVDDTSVIGIIPSPVSLPLYVIETFFMFHIKKDLWDRIIATCVMFFLD